MHFNSHLPANLNSPLVSRQRVSHRGMGLNALMAAVILATTFSTQDAQALALGRLTIQSALGEPLVAEIDVPEITAAEASSLRVTMAPAQVYRAAGVDVNPALANTDIRLLRRPDGKAFLRITNPKSINEPYLDLMLEANWAAGRVVRDYTLLLDPPNLRAPVAPPPPAPTAPTVSAPVAPAPQTTAAQAPESTSATPPAASTPIASPSPADAKSPATPAKVPTAVAKTTPTTQPKVVDKPKATDKPVARAQTPKAGKLTVKAGDTAGRIAQANRAPNATLEQMLVAMLKANPDAFINGNVNLIRAGSIIDLPDEQATAATSSSEASQMVLAQSRDFNDFRQRLASAARPVSSAPSGQKATGKVQAEVKDQRPSAQAPDKLKLSKGVISAPKTPSAEDTIAQNRQAKATADKTAELQRNLADLTKLEAAVKAVPATPTPVAPPAPPAPVVAPAPAVPAVAVAAPTPPVSPTPEPQAKTDPAPAVEPPKPDDKPADKPAEPVAPPAPVAAVPPPAEPAPPPPATHAQADESDLLTNMLDNPLALPAAGGLVALLLGFGAYRIRQRKKISGVDSSYLESRLPSDSFFGSSGGQKVDTAEAAVSGSSMMYSPSQLDVGGDVDPVAEADVYLAYGRDLQAEEILKEAMRITPSRVAIHSKMLEIYAKRRDTKAFEMLACEVYALSHGTGPAWTQACNLGMELDPTNPLYQPGGSPAVLASATDVEGSASPGMAMTQPFHDDDLNPPDAADGPLDLDLDFSIDASQASKASSQADGLTFDMPYEPEKEGITASDLDQPSASPSSPPAEATASSSAFDLTADDLAFTLPDEDVGSVPPDTAGPATDFGLNFDATQDLPPIAPTAEPTVRMELPKPYEDVPTEYIGLGDFGASSLDLGDATPGDMSLDDIPDGDPLETKLSLASEFMDIGDEEGARSLAEEVLEEASGPLKAKASAFLDNLG